MASTTPLFIKRHTIPGFAFNVDVSGETVYATGDSSGITAIDISNLSKISTIGRFNTPGVVSDVCASGDKVYVADGTNGVLVLQATRTEGTPPRFSSLPSTNIVLNAHQDLSVTVRVFGDQPLVLNWYRNGVQLPNETNQLVIPNITTDLEGTYSVIASNAWGTAEAQFQVRILGEPLLLPKFSSGQINFEIRNGPESYAPESLKYLEIQSSTDLSTWTPAMQAISSPIQTVSINTSTAKIFYRIVEYPQPPATP